MEFDVLFSGVDRDVGEVEPISSGQVTGPVQSVVNVPQGTTASGIAGKDRRLS